MSDVASGLSPEQPSSIPPAGRVSEDRLMPGIVYGLYILGLTHGLTIIIGLIVAYMNRATAGPVMETHYSFQIRTFWMSIWWAAIGALLAVVGAIFSIVLIGLPFLWLGCSILGLVWLWFLVRCVVGAVYLTRGEAHPRPLSWLF